MVRMRVISANVNGIRAAVRRGGLSWLADAEPDVLCLQEVRASDAELTAALADRPSPAGTSPTRPAVRRAGRASRCCPAARTGGVRCELEDERGGRRPAGGWRPSSTWRAGPVTVVSVYVHTGEAETPRQEEKYRFLDAMTLRMKELADGGRRVVVTGDLNIAHTRADLRNWKGNLGKAGFLPEEQAYLDRWLEPRRVGRRVTAGRPGRWRARTRGGPGAARPSTTTPGGGSTTSWRRRRSPPALRGTWVGRAATYAERWSDHAAVVADYDLA